MAQPATADAKKDNSKSVALPATPASDAAAISSTTMHVKVYAPFKTYFDGMANSVSAVNDTGPFDILPKHHNFMTLINQCEISIHTETGEQRIAINRGVMHVKANQVVVFLDV